MMHEAMHLNLLQAKPSVGAGLVKNCVVATAGRPKGSWLSSNFTTKDIKRKIRNLCVMPLPKVAKLIPVFRTFFSLGTLISPVLGANGMDQTAVGCSRFRREPTTQEQIAIFSKSPTEDPSAFLRKTITYSKEYLYDDMASLIFDNLPLHEKLFALDMREGQPVRRRNATASGGGLGKHGVMVFLQGFPNRDIVAELRADALVPPTQKGGGQAVQDASYPDLVHGEKHLAGFDLVEIKGRIDQSHEFYVKLADNGQIVETLKCNRVETVPIPACELKLQDKNFLITVSGIRTQFYDQVPHISRLVREFAACLVTGEE